MNPPATIFAFFHVYVGLPCATASIEPAIRAKHKKSPLRTTVFFIEHFLQGSNMAVMHLHTLGEVIPSQAEWCGRSGLGLTDFNKIFHPRRSQANIGAIPR